MGLEGEREQVVRETEGGSRALKGRDKPRRQAQQSGNNWLADGGTGWKGAGGEEKFAMRAVSGGI